MADRLVHCTIDDGVATVTLDSPGNRNALSRALLDDLTSALDDALTPGVRAVVLSHTGPAFCAGADLKERSVGPPDSSPMVRQMQRLADADQPTIAAVKGAVRAGGVGIMASCDLVVVHSSVSFAFTEVRIGVAPAIISVPILRRVSPGELAAPFLTGETFGADRALQMGLVTHVSDDVDGTVANLCEGIRSSAPTAIAQTKRLLRLVPTLSTEDAFAQMQALSESLFAGAEAQEGMRAFAEKRAPRWGDQTSNR